MKKFFVIFVLCFIVLSFDVFSQIKVTNTGMVGINETAPVHNLHWYGTGCFGTTWGRLIFDSSGNGNVATIYPADDWVGALGKSDKWFNSIYVNHVHTDYVYNYSDEKLKSNIKELDKPLAKLKKLRGVKYDFKRDVSHIEKEDIKKQIEDQGKNQIGFIAQEMKSIFPELIHLDTTKNLYSINYIQLIPVLVEALKEQQEQIETLESNIKLIEQDCCKSNLKSASVATGIDSQLSQNIASLDQNIPNPFTDQTRISCYIPDNSKLADLYIYNMQGNQLQQHQINGAGNQNIKIEGNSLTPGMYLYSLVVDGKIIDTKRMILTK